MFKRINGFALVGLVWLTFQIVASFEFDDYETVDNNKLGEQMKSSQEDVRDYLGQLNRQAVEENNQDGIEFEDVRITNRQLDPKVKSEELKVGNESIPQKEDKSEKDSIGFKDEKVEGDKKGVDKEANKIPVVSEPADKGKPEMIPPVTESGAQDADSSKKKQLGTFQGPESNTLMDLFDYITDLGDEDDQSMRGFDLPKVDDSNKRPNKSSTSSSSSFSTKHHHDFTFEESNSLDDGEISEEFKEWLKKMGIDLM